MTNLVLYSGGLDSTVLLYSLLKKDPVCLSFHYGSRHNQRESEAAAAICKMLGIERIVYKMDPWVTQNALTGDVPMPHGHYTDAIMQQTVVPLRNAIMLSIAAGIVESRGGGTIYAAMHAGDRLIYPDCRPQFIHAMNIVAHIGCVNQVTISAPFIDIDKKDIVALGRKLNVPFDKTWTCYEGGETSCGKCGSCVERKEALDAQ